MRRGMMATSFRPDCSQDAIANVMLLDAARSSLGVIQYPPRIFNARSPAQSAAAVLSVGRSIPKLLAFYLSHTEGHCQRIDTEESPIST